MIICWQNILFYAILPWLRATKIHSKWQPLLLWNDQSSQPLPNYNVKPTVSRSLIDTQHAQISLQSTSSIMFFNPIQTLFGPPFRPDFCVCFSKQIIWKKNCRRGNCRERGSPKKCCGWFMRFWDPETWLSRGGGAVLLLPGKRVRLLFHGIRTFRQ